MTWGPGFAAAILVTRAGSDFGTGAAVLAAGSGFFSSPLLNSREKKLPDWVEVPPVADLDSVPASPNKGPNDQLPCDEEEEPPVPSLDGDTECAST